MLSSFGTENTLVMKLAQDNCTVDFTLGLLKLETILCLYVLLLKK